MEGAEGRRQRDVFRLIEMGRRWEINRKEVLPGAYMHQDNIS